MAKGTPLIEKDYDSVFENLSKKTDGTYREENKFCKSDRGNSVILFLWENATIVSG